MKKALLKLMSCMAAIAVLVTSFGISPMIQSSAQSDDTVYLSDIRIRDPFVLADESSGKYYMYYASGTNVYCLESNDLIHWNNRQTVFENDGSYNLNWAPEIYLYNGSYYMFTTLRETETENKGCYILKSNSPTGPFTMHSGRITDSALNCIDGTLYIDENGTPYMIFCGGFTNYEDNIGDIQLVALSNDLKTTQGESQVLFRADANPYCNEGVTDAPFIYTASDGRLVMLWSNYKDGKYAIIKAYSENGITGPWTQDSEPLFTDDGGHAMIFTDFSGQKKITFHIQNSVSYGERAVIYDFNDNGGSLSVEVTAPERISVETDAIMRPAMPAKVNNSDYAVLSGNMRAECEADHSAWVHSLNLAVSGTTRNESYGFNIMYTNDIDTNVVKLNNAASAATFNGDTIKQTTYVNRPELENLFSESGLDFKLIRMGQMAYLLVKLNGVYEQLGRMCLPENTPTQFFFSNWKTPVVITDVTVETGEKAATDALCGMSFSFTSASVRNYPLSASDWQLEMRVFDTDAENAVEKRLVTVGELSLYSKPDQDDGRWMIQRMKSGDWSRVLIPDEISAALSSGGMYIRFVRKGTNLSAYVSADGKNYTFIKERTDVDSAADVKMQNWQPSVYDKFMLSTAVTAYDDITLSTNGSAAPLVPTYVESSEYAVFSGNIRALCAADHSAWVHTLNLSASGSELGFNIMYTNNINTNVVKLKSASTAVTFNGEAIPEKTYVNRPELENLFGENGFDFKLVRMERMVYLLVNLTGSYEILGRMYLPENATTQFYFSTWKTPLEITGISVETGEQAAANAFRGVKMSFSDTGENTSVRNFVLADSDWIFETRVTDTQPDSTAATKRLITVGELSLVKEISGESVYSGKWRIQRMKSGDWSSEVIPDEIADTLSSTGMYIRFIKNGTQLSAWVSADGISYTLMKSRDDVTADLSTVQFKNWQAAVYDRMVFEAEGEAAQYADANLDGEVNIVDLVRLKKYQAEAVTPNIGEFKAADISRNGRIDAQDSVELRKYLLK